MDAIRQADYRRVAQLHADTIDQGFLSTLGPRFLSLLYQAIDECPDACLLLAREGERVVGFVAGTLNMGQVYRHLLRHWLALGLSLAPTLLMPRRLWRIVEILRYSRGGHGQVRASGAEAIGVETTGAEMPTLPTAELLSIAVDPACQGRGMAADLYAGLKIFFATRGQGAFKIIVGAPLAPAHRFYRRMGAEPVAEIEVHRGADSTVYVQRVGDV
ncbi:MAG: GNAT family N-acetyltransferase [Chromatiaceae bacterium]|nr:GNAT family N-acetyltransferase [Chromatiaceae bacterium]